MWRRIGISREQSSPLQADGAPGGGQEAGAPGRLHKPGDQFPIFFFHKEYCKAFLLILSYFAKEKHSSRGYGGKMRLVLFKDREAFERPRTVGPP